MECLCVDCFFECCSIEDKLTGKNNTPIAKKIVSWILLVGIGICLILIAVFNIKWYSNLQPYYMRAGGFTMILSVIAIVTAVASFVALFFLFLYFILGFCGKNGNCVWGFFNFLSFAVFIMQIVIFALGSLRDVDDVKCSKPLSECYNGMYNQTLGKIDYIRYDEEQNKKYLEEWNEFLDWYYEKIADLDKICEKALSPILTVGIVHFILYITLLMIYGGWDCIRERLCICCCCSCCDFDCETCWNCNSCTSKEKVSNERNNSENELNNENTHKINILIPNQNDQNTTNNQNDQNSYNQSITP